MAARQSLPRLTGAEREKVSKAMVKDYDKGLSLRQVAAKYGRGIGGARTLLIEGGVKWRGNSGPRKKPGN